MAGGDEVGSHGMYHSPSWFLSPKRSRLEIQESVATLHGMSGITVRCFRPPWGMSNLVTHYWLRQAAQKVASWSLDSLDWFFMTPAKVIVKKVFRWVCPAPSSCFMTAPGCGAMPRPWWKHCRSCWKVCWNGDWFP